MVSKLLHCKNKLCNYTMLSLKFCSLCSSSSDQTVFLHKLKKKKRCRCSYNFQPFVHLHDDYFGMSTVLSLMPAILTAFTHKSSSVATVLDY